MRIVSTLLIAACFLVGATVASADQITTVDVSISNSLTHMLVAQQNLNPTNDPDVQRGIDQRQEQARQSRINACVQQAEAGMTPSQRIQNGDAILRNCTGLEPAVAAVRG